MARRPRKTARQWAPSLAGAGFGALLSVAFPPEGWWWLAPLCVAGFTVCCRIAAEQREWQRRRRRPAAAGASVGLLFGAAFCVIFFRWITSVGVDVWVLLAVLETLYFIPFGAATAAVARLRAAPLWQALLWVALEALRDRFPLGGMSWGRLAFSQTDTPLTPLSALGGAPLVTFATALIGTVIAAIGLSAWRRRRPVSYPIIAEAAAVDGTVSVANGFAHAAPSEADVPAESSASREPGAIKSAFAKAASSVSDSAAVTRLSSFADARPLGVRGAAAWALIAIAVPVVGLLVPIQTTAGKPVQMVAIQGNVVQPGINSYGNQNQVLLNHMQVTAQYAADVAAGKAPQPQVVIWPEDSDDVDPYAYPQVGAELTAAAANIKAPILVGAVVGVGPGQVRSEGIVWSPATGPGQSYSKRHLVPFGEYIPFRATLTKYFSELSRVPDDFVPGSTPGVLTIGGVKIADVICFEVAYDDIVRSSVLGDGGVLVVQTNNADYGWTGQPEQQLAISQLRAVESGRPVLIASTSGISGYITPDGVIHQQTGQFTAAVVAADITPRTGLTLADRVGPLPEWLMTALAAAATLGAVLLARRARRRQQPAVAGQVPDVLVQPDEAGSGIVTASSAVPRKPAGGPTAAAPPHPDRPTAPAPIEQTEQTEARKAPA